MLYVDELAQYIGRKTGSKLVKKGRRFNSERFIEFRVED
jgi:hypothetical protein